MSTELENIVIPEEPQSEAEVFEWLKRLRLVLVNELAAIKAAIALQSLVTARRLHSVRGTEIVAGDVSVTSGAGIWATTPPTPVISGNDQRGSITITAAATPTANPGWELTFADGDWVEIPEAMVVRNDNATPTPSISWSVTKSALTLTFHGTATAGQVYTFDYQVWG